VRNVIKNLKPNKAPGHDGVTNSMLKQLSYHFVNHLVVIYNSALKLQHFPETWKKADVVTIPKQGKDPKFPQNRRPISLLSCLGKVYEKIILERFKKFVFTNNLIPDEQFGFIPGCSTTHQLIRLMEYITSGFERKMTTVAVFLDINKAYDSTWHTGLIYKLLSMNFPGELIRVIDSFLVRRSFRVKV
jgi:Reverse transcriptase (RNA-dependent DNA polymerase).